MIERKTLLEKLLLLRCRIEDWTLVHGWKDMDNYRETKNKKGKVVYKLSDWEFVDNMYGSVVNGPDGFGNDYFFDKNTIKAWNKMWKRYELYTGLVKNPNLESEWEAIQQMNWDDFKLNE